MVFTRAWVELGGLLLCFAILQWWGQNEEEEEGERAEGEGTMSPLSSPPELKCR